MKLEASEDGHDENQAPGNSGSAVPGLADLIREISETNRLLRGLISQNSASQNQAEKPAARPEATTPRAPSPSHCTAGDSPVITSVEPDLMEIAGQLAGERLRSVFEMDQQHMISIRDEFIDYLWALPGGQTLSEYEHTGLRSQQDVLIKLKTAKGLEGLLWHFVPKSVAYFPSSNSNASHPDFPDPEMISSLVEQWPLDLASLPKLEGLRIIPDPSKRSRPTHRKTWQPEPWFYCSPLFSLSGGPLFPATAAQARISQHQGSPTTSTDLTSPASFWMFQMPGFLGPGADIHLFALVLYCLSVVEGSSGVPWNLLSRFFLGVQTRSLSSNLGLSITYWGELEDRFSCEYSHTLRCFSGSSSLRFLSGGRHFTGVACERAYGSIYTLQGGGTYYFEEYRMTILGSCVFMKSCAAPAFSVVILDDLRKPREAEDRYMNWEEHGFAVAGENAAHHFLQCILFAALRDWLDQWQNTLDGLERLVSIDLQDITDWDESENLMFDTSFARSRVYFKSLQLLRIFSQTIRSTRTGIRQLDPERFKKRKWDRQFSTSSTRPLISPESNPAEDDILLANWKILWTFYVEAESRLLGQIAEKTDEIKSLRDGLFNATSLREASRSTTMNRYIIVFTIVTVLYLPPSLIATVFGTDLFNSEDTAETVDRFKISTIAISLSTYVFALLLIWLADKLDYPRNLYFAVKEMFWDTWEKIRALRHPDSDSDSDFS